ncbi:hypothetical protein SBOR_8874 [Sclerotinia borealis F-4128]|uniref:BTB domain-containing protein n=1 Tax=Sclerotinia borealis (strain F-4128) TaxID=1432307 RepID=W9C841_SCLBF|nr:hypothetical protein SBOR_8874 [Sclerotinia borealis F-4128]
MTNLSGPVTIVDPDGDLVLLWGPIPSGDSNQYKHHVLVSSKHMLFASPVFKAMLKGGFQEAIELKTIGKTEIPLPDDDSTAMIILTDIIHGRLKSCHEATQLLCTVWATDFLPTDSWKQNWFDTACWICVAWVFELDTEFKKATEEVIRRSGIGLGPILEENELDFPVPADAIDDVDERRQSAGPTIICPTFTSPEYKVPYDPTELANYLVNSKSHREYCDSMVLGYLIKSATAQGLFPLPQAPLYNSLSLDALKTKVRSLKVTTGCTKMFQRSCDDHDILKTLKQSVAKVDSQICGLDLASFKKPRRGT